MFCSPAFAIAQSRLSSVTTWGYQLQNISVPDLVASDVDLVVIDYSSNGSDRERYTPAEIKAIKDSGKLVLAYLSIGEAEDYRFYFRRSWVKRRQGKPCGVSLTDDAPEWLDQPNREWCGNYKTRFWHRDWQRIIYGRTSGRQKSYLDRILDAGFDGVYLDIVDGYEYWQSRRGKQKRASAPADMARFVIALSRYARERREQPNFIVVPQNGSGILDSLREPLRTNYLAAIDGIGAEDTFFYGTEDEDNALNVQEETLSNLRKFQEAGKSVLSVEYLTDVDLALSFRVHACTEGFLPYASVRGLDRLFAGISCN